MKAATLKGLKIGVYAVGIGAIITSLVKTYAPYRIALSPSSSIASGVYLTEALDISNVQFGDMVQAYTYAAYFEETGPVTPLLTIKRVAGTEGDQIRWEGERLIRCEGEGKKRLRFVSALSRLEEMDDPRTTQSPERDKAGRGEGGCQVVASRLPDNRMGANFPKPTFPEKVPEGHVLLIAEHPASFDGRYYGLMPLSALTRRARPLWVTWPDIDSAWDVAEEIYGESFGGRPERWEKETPFPPQGLRDDGDAVDVAFPDSPQGEASDSASSDSALNDSAVSDSRFSLILGLIPTPSVARGVGQ